MAKRKLKKRKPARATRRVKKTSRRGKKLRAAKKRKPISANMARRMRRRAKLHAKQKARLAAAVRKYGSVDAARAAIRREGEEQYRQFEEWANKDYRNADSYQSRQRVRWEQAHGAAAPKAHRASPSATSRREPTGRAARLIPKLQALANDPGATPGERAAAQMRIKEMLG